MNGGAISWCSKKQSCIALSTMEAEYIACCASVQEAVWLRRFLKHLTFVKSAHEPIHIWSDSTAALAFAKDPKYHGRTKHIEMKFHYVRDMIGKKKVVLKHISTSQMVADPLTKPIAKDLFQAHVKALGLGNK